jgi:superfamily II DNA helicase RecQ
MFGKVKKMADIEVKAALEKILPFFHIDQLKREQMKILEAILEKKDCIAVLPTGYGKSLPFQIAVSVKRVLHRDDADEKIIVCCPLVALMKDQVTRLNCLPDIKAKFKGKLYDFKSNIARLHSMHCKLHTIAVLQLARGSRRDTFDLAPRI